jgi:GNAT superfamily N-acetyltransferase
MEVSVRQAETRDVASLVNGNVAMALEAEHKHLDPRIVERGVRAVFDSPGHGRYFVAEAEGKVVGQAMYTCEWSDWRNGNFLWLQSVYVEPVARRTGVFRAIFGFIERLAKTEPGVCGLRLYVELDNERAQQTYRRCGMVAKFEMARQREEMLFPDEAKKTATYDSFLLALEGLSNMISNAALAVEEASRNRAEGGQILGQQSSRHEPRNVRARPSSSPTIYRLKG